ncbi:MAG: methionyl-tRNA formyltransferase, partial [Bacteroidota bacterium]|nr:methionyl-tRNA formyltransferase [Bacteroidota bacterium]
KLIKVFKVKVNKDIRLNPGEISTMNGTISIGCIDFSLDILELQLEGKRRMDSETFLRGNRL